MHCGHGRLHNGMPRALGHQPARHDRRAARCHRRADASEAQRDDVIVRGPEFRVPARPPKNVIEWATAIIPSGFTKDTWITSFEIKTSDLTVTHHICATFVPHRENVKYYEW